MTEESRKSNGKEKKNANHDEADQVSSTEKKYKEDSQMEIRNASKE